MVIAVITVTLAVVPATSVVITAASSVIPVVGVPHLQPRTTYQITYEQ
jgi:hypothetical protein